MVMYIVVLSILVIILLGLLLLKLFIRTKHLTIHVYTLSSFLNHNNDNNQENIFSTYIEKVNDYFEGEGDAGDGGDGE